MLLKRDWKGERDWWLDHFYQFVPGQLRSSKATTLVPSDYVAIPLPTNVPAPLAQPCLIWRWALGGGGYGSLQGRGAHVVAYEQTRGVAVHPGSSVLHLCHRPFCVQPAHLYEGTDKENAEDRKALNSEMRTYATWDMIGDRYGKAFTEHRWPAPPLAGVISIWTLTKPWSVPTPSHGQQGSPGNAPTAADPGPIPSSTGTE